MHDINGCTNWLSTCTCTCTYTWTCVYVHVHVYIMYMYMYINGTNRLSTCILGLQWIFAPFEYALGIQMYL